MELTHFSTFSGVGGLDLGLERAGWRTVAFSEIDPYASAVLAQRWPGVPNLGDIVALADAARRGGEDRGRGAGGHGAEDLDWRTATLWSGGRQADDEVPASEGADAPADQGVGGALRSGLVGGQDRGGDGRDPAIHVGPPTPTDPDARPAGSPAPEADLGHPGEACGDPATLPLAGGADHRGPDTGREEAGRDVPVLRGAGDGHRPRPVGGAGRPDHAGEPPTSLPPLPRREVTGGSSPDLETTEGGDAAWKSATLWSGGFP